MFEDGQQIPRGGGQYLVGRPYHVAGRTYYPHEDDALRRRGHGLLVRRRVPRPQDRQWRDLRQERAVGRASDHAAAELRPRHQLSNGYSVIVRVNDRGPYAAGRVMDVSSRVADVLDFKRMGTAHVKVEYVGRAPMEGSDDDELLATLRTDGGPASIGGAPTMVAEAASPLLSLFGSKSAPPPPPPPPPPEEARRPPRRRRPRRRSAAARRAAGDGSRRRRRAARAASARGKSQRRERRRRRGGDQVAPRAAAPLPPARPYDLGVREAAFAPKPPRRGSHERDAHFAPLRPAREEPLARLAHRRRVARSQAGR